MFKVDDKVQCVEGECIGEVGVVNEILDDMILVNLTEPPPLGTHCSGWVYSKHWKVIKKDRNMGNILLAARNLLRDKDTKTLIKHGIFDEYGNITDEGMLFLIDYLLNENKAAIASKVREAAKELKAMEDCK